MAQLEAFGVALQMVLSGGRRGDLRTVVGAYAQATGKNVERTTRGYTAARGRIGEGLGGIGERMTAYASGRMSDEDRARSLSYLPERIRGTGHARPSSPKVDARQTVSVTIHEATDAREVDRRVQEGIREAGERQARQLVAALVPGGES